MKNMKKAWKKVMAKSLMVGTGAYLALSPIGAEAAGTAPSTYVNKISDGLFAEIMKVVPKVALVVVVFCVFMYLVNGDEHKKSKYKGSAFVALGAYLILLVLKPLIDWFSGFMG